MTFHIITIFPQIFDFYFKESILGRAQKKGLIKIKIYNLRDFTKDKHKTVDDKSYGGGAGMIFKIEPIYKAVQKIKRDILSFSVGTWKRGNLSKKEKKALDADALKNLAKNRKKDWKIINSWAKENKIWQTILFSVKGKTYQQETARKFSHYQNLILICPRYEGADERIAQYIADQEISIGNYILTGGEIPAMIVADSVTRLLPQVLGNSTSLAVESFAQKNYLEYPQYTYPKIFLGWKVPKILLSGNHIKIKAWRKKKSKIKK
jgi:tRNA (guanine37-N1)-methyltransferase